MGLAADGASEESKFVIYHFLLFEHDVEGDANQVLRRPQALISILYLLG